MDDKIDIKDILNQIYDLKTEIRCSDLDEDEQECRIDILDEIEDCCYTYLDLE